MVAFKNYVSEKLPHIGYLSIIDWYVMCCFLLALVVVYVGLLQVLWNPF